MSPLNIHPEENVTSPKKKNNKMLKVMLGIGALVLVPVIGTTRASNIRINGETNVTFGQGQQAAIACDEDVTMIPRARYYGGNYILKEIEVTSTNLDDCAGKTVIISAADSVGNSALEIGLVAQGQAGSDYPVSASATLTAGSEGCDLDYFTCTYTPPVFPSTRGTLLVEVNQFKAIDATLINNLLIQQTD